MAFWSIILITFSHYLPGAFAKAVSFKTERIAAIHRLQAGATIAIKSARTPGLPDADVAEFGTGDVIIFTERNRKTVAVNSQGGIRAGLVLVAHGTGNSRT